MPLSTWLALAFLLVVAAAGTTAAVLRTLRLWRSLRSLQRVLGAGFEDVLRRAGAVETRVAAAGSRAAKLDAAVARLRSSRARAAVLAQALAETRTTLAHARATLPRK